MKVLTVEQAVEQVNNGGNLEGVVLEENSLKQVNVRDAMVLSRGGIVIPEQNIYYDDEDIEYDEEIDGLTITSGIVQLSWEEKAKRAAAQQKQTPQEADDEGIADDEAFEGDWKPIATDGLPEAESVLAVQLHLDPKIKAWLDQQPITAGKLIESLLDQFYRMQQMIGKKK